MPIPTEIVVYSRPECHLCDEAKALLRRHELPFREVDIDQHSELQEQYNHWVPVVIFDGQERFRGRIDERLLIRLLRAKS